MGIRNRLKNIGLARFKQAVLSNPMERRYYDSRELRQMGFASIGENVRIERSCVVVNPAYITIGDNVLIDQFTFLIAGKEGVKLGSWIHIAGHNLLGGNGGLVMEDFSNISAGSKLISASDDFAGGYLVGPSVPPEHTSVKRAPIILKEHTILGVGTVVLPGVVCGNGTATGANTVLLKSTDPWGIYVGSPAKRVKERARGVEQKALEVREAQQKVETKVGAVPKRENI